jgi:hypothetical protein
MAAGGTGMKGKVMLQSVKQLYGNKLAASDGEIGQVKDFYFDDRNWAVRYVVADTGSWLPGRQILLSPHAFGALHEAGKLPPVHLTRRQIENSPPIESHKPVSRQFEDEYYQYYGWPYYWQGNDLWGMSAFPIMEPPLQRPPSQPAAADGPQPKRADAHLRSAQAVNGYEVQANDGVIGHICDFMMDARSWAIGQMVVKTGHRFSGKEVQMATGKVRRINYEESSVLVDLTGEAVEQGSGHHPAPAGAVG